MTLSPAAPQQAHEIYDHIRDDPIVSPHGHCDPHWFAENAAFSDPADLIIIPDHYLFRMLYSQGVDLNSLGVGLARENRDPRATFRLFAEHWDLFLGTPSRVWLEYMFRETFGLDEPLSGPSSNAIYDAIDAKLRTDEFRPRQLFDRFGIDILATTDAATDDLGAHQEIRNSGWGGRVIPTFRPDDLLNPLDPAFTAGISLLEERTGITADTFQGFLGAIQFQREVFRSLGATATDHAVENVATCYLNDARIQELFDKALAGQCSEREAAEFTGHMLVEMAQMSVEDGLIMQIHAGSRRNTNSDLMGNFGRDMGADIPVATDWVRGLGPLLNRVGNDVRFRLILFTLDEATYARELAPMAGHWPCLRIGPPWWFHDSERGIARYFDQVVETAGYWNLAGFNDDTRAFMSIPARHDVWRQGVALHLAGQIERGAFGQQDALRIAKELSTERARDAYRLGQG